MTKVDLSKFNNEWYQSGPFLKLFAWYFINVLFFINPLNPSNSIKLFFLKLFDAKIGEGVIIKPGVNIKYPWKLTIGKYSWIGEKVWIDNLDEVVIGANVCVSQGVLILSGNHDYKKESFDLMIGEIEIEDGAWIGAKSIVCQNVKMASHSVLAVGSVLSHSTEAYKIYKGNPAIVIRDRKMD